MSLFPFLKTPPPPPFDERGKVVCLFITGHSPFNGPNFYDGVSLRTESSRSSWPVFTPFSTLSRIAGEHLISRLAAPAFEFPPKPLVGHDREIEDSRPFSVFRVVKSLSSFCRHPPTSEAKTPLLVSVPPHALFKA